MPPPPKTFTQTETDNTRLTDRLNIIQTINLVFAEITIIGTVTVTVTFNATTFQLLSVSATNTAARESASLTVAGHKATFPPGNTIQDLSAFGVALALIDGFPDIPSLVGYKFSFPG